jgi:hypothetical protein
LAKLNPERLVFGLYLLVLVIAGEVVLSHLDLPSWPAFLVMILFFVEHMEIKKAPEILVGGCAGLACLILAQIMVGALAPMLGVEIATLVFVAVVVYAIVACGEIAPVVCNNYAFIYLTVSAAIAKLSPESNVYAWMGIELIGGGIFIAGVIGIVKTMAAISMRNAADVQAKADPSAGIGVGG